MNKDLILQYVKEENMEMVSLVNMDNFIKCMGAIGTLQFKDIVNDKQVCENIARYLNEWADSKRWLFNEFYDHKLTVDIDYSANKLSDDWYKEFSSLKDNEEYMIYGPYISYLSEHIDFTDVDNLNCYNFRYANSPYFSDEFQRRLSECKDMKITTIADRWFHLPKNLVDHMGRILDSNKITCTLTMSIDPVDILTCSTNGPDGWRSCYRVYYRGCGEHADGALAAMIDSNSQIVYGWNKEVEIDVGGEMNLKGIRKKLFRAWVNVTSNFKAIHVASAYPDRDTAHTKMIREGIEKLIADKYGFENKWILKDLIDINRKYRYGYDEFSGSRVYIQKEYEELLENGSCIENNIEVYDKLLFAIDAENIIIAGSDYDYYTEDDLDDIEDEAWDEYYSYHSLISEDDYYDEDGNFDETAYYNDSEEERERLRDDFYNQYEGPCSSECISYEMENADGYYYMFTESIREDLLNSIY